MCKRPTLTAQHHRIVSTVQVVSIQQTLRLFPVLAVLGEYAGGRELLLRPRLSIARRQKDWRAGRLSLCGTYTHLLPCRKACRRTGWGSSYDLASRKAIPCLNCLMLKVLRRQYSLLTGHLRREQSA